MLENVDLTLKLDKTTYKEALPRLQERLRECQNLALESSMPVVVVFEGWDGAGKGSNISQLAEKLDPRHFKVHPIGAPSGDERGRPFLWRFWRRLPPAGDIAVFDRSWYGRVLIERVEKLIQKAEWRLAFNEISEFERQLTDDGTLIVKFWLQISKKEQRKRFERLEDDPAMSWKVTKEDWRHHKAYRDYEAAVEEMLARTGTHWAPWTIVEAEDERYGSAKIHETLIRAIESGVEEVRRGRENGSRDGVSARADTNPVGSPPAGSHPVEAAAVEATEQEPRAPGAGPDQPGVLGASTLLDQVDLTQTLSREEYRATLRPLQAELRRLQRDLIQREVPVLIVYEGWDAAGKGGNIMRLTQFLDPRGYFVTAYAAPTDEEKRHHYLWRFWRDLPYAGQIGIFDRSWYGRVLVERVEGFCSEKEWRRAYQEINEFEAQLTAERTVLVKFWLHVSPDEQLRRFEERAEDKFRHWKLTEDDWRNRQKLPLYREAVVEMLERTSTAWAPWTIVEANDKPFARVKTLRTTIDAVREVV
ncbi:MAG: phosphate--AMP phosphotransferase [Gemmatimonadetes bacterium]|nr:phosphate--AMP phosphotransferase [Gemmatimonadota bacterium]